MLRSWDMLRRPYQAPTPLCPAKAGLPNTVESFRVTGLTAPALDLPLPPFRAS